MELVRCGRRSGGGFASRNCSLSFLAIYGPISVILLLMLWGGLMIVAFAMIFQGLGARFVGASGPIGFGTLDLHECVDVPDARAR